ncbi:MAG: MarR family winged helix-turn-helix transcriptional regulator [Flavobacteriaceae bacterium]|nr:MarR family winged helix-turn-helix transcriptional regulator [Flavobacteriaceae bacterium]
MNNQKNKYCGCLYYSANAFARIMTKIAEEEFAITGLAPSYALLLMSVNEQPGIQPKSLSEHMQLTPSTVTRLIEKMEHRGLVKRSSVGRATEVHPTKKSLELKSVLKKAWQNLFKRYTAILGEKQAKELTTKVYEAFLRLDQEYITND